MESMYDIEQSEKELQEAVETMSPDAREAWEEILVLVERARDSEADNRT